MWKLIMVWGFKRSSFATAWNNQYSSEPLWTGPVMRGGCFPNYYQRLQAQTACEQVITMRNISFFNLDRPWNCHTSYFCLECCCTYFNLLYKLTLYKALRLYRAPNNFQPSDAFSTFWFTLKPVKNWSTPEPVDPCRSFDESPGPKTFTGWICVTVIAWHEASLMWQTAFDLHSVVSTWSTAT